MSSGRVIHLNMKIPIVDFSAQTIENWSDLGEEEVKDLAKNIFATFTNYGFLYLRNSGITPDDVSSLPHALNSYTFYVAVKMMSTVVTAFCLCPIMLIKLWQLYS